MRDGYSGTNNVVNYTTSHDEKYPLTELGEDLVRRYGVLARKFDNLARREFKAVATGSARQGEKTERVPRRPVSKSSKDS